MTARSLKVVARHKPQRSAAREALDQVIREHAATERAAMKARDAVDRARAMIVEAQAKLTKATAAIEKAKRGTSGSSRPGRRESRWRPFVGERHKDRQGSPDGCPGPA